MLRRSRFVALISLASAITLGLAASVTLPKQGVTLGGKYFEEFASRSTFEGYSVQISVAIRF